MAAISTTDVIRQVFAAYETKNGEALEALIAEDFVFSSPQDDRINRATYFERCWPFSAEVKLFELEKVFVEGDEAFVAYEAELKSGRKFRNTEFFRVENGKLKEVTVYFGRNTN